MINKLLTLIVPTYNMEAYLPKCLSSLIVDNKGLMDMLEVIVINDGSTDRSSDIAHEYELRYPDTFRVTDKENGNYGSCINRGLKEAKGKYIKILDADDWFDKECFALFLKLTESLDVDIILNDVNHVDMNGMITKQWIFPCEKEMVIPFSLSYQNVEKLEMHMVAYKADILQRIGYHQTEGRFYTDQEWITWPLVEVETAYSTNLPLYQYLQGREGQTISKDILYKRFDDMAAMVYSLGNIWRRYDGTREKKEMLFHKFTYKVSEKYVDYFKRHWYPKQEFRNFDKTLLLDYPEAKQYTDIFVEHILHIDFHIVALWRYRLLWIYDAVCKLSVAKRRIVNALKEPTRIFLENK